jgi:hypothetical protein
MEIVTIVGKWLYKCANDDGLVKARYMTTGIVIKIRWKAAKTTIEGAICMPSLSKLQKSEKR